MASGIEGAVRLFDVFAKICLARSTQKPVSRGAGLHVVRCCSDVRGKDISTFDVDEISYFTLIRFLQRFCTWRVVVSIGFGCRIRAVER